MNKRDLKQIVRSFRDGLIGSQRGDSDMQCAVVCYPLQSYLSFLGEKSTIEEVGLRYGNHVFLKLENGKVLDPTADQFGDYPKVYLGDPLWFHKDYEKRMP